MSPRLTGRKPNAAAQVWRDRFDLQPWSVKLLYAPAGALHNANADGDINVIYRSIVIRLKARDEVERDYASVNYDPPSEEESVMHELLHAKLLEADAKFSDDAKEELFINDLIRAFLRVEGEGRKKVAKKSKGGKARMAMPMKGSKKYEEEYPEGHEMAGKMAAPFKKKKKKGKK